MKELSVEELLLKIPEVLYYSQEMKIQCAPNDYTPIFMDLKKVLSDYETRKLLATQLTNNIDNKIQYICGMESGGSYFASIIADTLNKPLGFLRAKDKKYKNVDKFKRFAGKLPPPNSKILIVDDVFATGLTIQDAITYFRQYDIEIELSVIFSYGKEEELAKKLGIKINALTNFEKLGVEAVKKGLLTENDIISINSHISNYNKFIQ